MPYHQDHLAGRVRVRPQLAARAGRHQDDAVVGDRVRAPQHVVRCGSELAHLPALRLPVQLLELRPDRVVSPRLVDLGREPELGQGLRERAVDLGSLRDHVQDELPGVVGAVGDQSVDSARLQRRRHACKPVGLGRTRKLHVRRPVVGQ